MNGRRTWLMAVTILTGVIGVSLLAPVVVNATTRQGPSTPDAATVLVSGYCPHSHFCQAVFDRCTEIDRIVMDETSVSAVLTDPAGTILWQDTEPSTAHSNESLQPGLLITSSSATLRLRPGNRTHVYYFVYGNPSAC